MNLLCGLLGLLGRRAARRGPQAAARPLRLLARLVPVRRAEARRAMEHALGLSSPQSAELCTALYDHYCLMTAEWLAAGQNPALLDQWVEVSPATLELLERHKHSGAVMLTAHWGNWELLGGWLARNGYPLSALAREIDDGEVGRFVAELRSALGVEVLYKAFGPSAGRSWARAVKNGRWLALLADQDGGPSGQPVRFLGLPATSVQGPAVLAKLTGAPLLPVFLRRLGPCRYRVEAFEPYDGPLATAADVERCTEWCNSLIERMVQSAPEQWFWFHRRWKSGKKEA